MFTKSEDQAFEMTKTPVKNEMLSEEDMHNRFEPNRSASAKTWPVDSERRAFCFVSLGHEVELMSILS